MFDIKMNCFDGKANHLKELQSFMSEIDGDIGTVNFNAQHPESVTKAIANMGKMIDEKAKNYQSNYKQQILDKASEILNNGAE